MKMKRFGKAININSIKRKKIDHPGIPRFRIA
jgi:hypothetical protein